MASCLQSIYYRLPAWLRAPIHPWLHRSGCVLRAWGRRAQERRLPLALLQGGAPNLGLWVCFVGREGAAPYLQRALLGRIEQPPPWSTQMPAAGLNAHAQRGLSGCNLLMAGLDEARAARHLPQALRFPALVEQWCTLPDTEAALEVWRRGGRERQKEINKIHALGLVSRITRDVEQIREFYELCHRPTILARHGAAAHVDEWPEFLRYVQNGAVLLQVMKDELMLAGVLIRQDGRLLHGMFNGVRDGDMALMRSGLLASEYYFSVIEGMRRGCTHQNFGRSRPFLGDGVLQFKRKFAGVVRPCQQEPTALCLQVLHWSTATLDRLAENPVMAWLPAAAAPAFERTEENVALGVDALVPSTVTGDVLTCCRFLTGGDPAESDRDLAGQLRRIYYPGTAGMSLWALDAAWQERLRDIQGLRERVDFPLTVLTPPLGDNSLPTDAAWGALMEQWARPTWQMPLTPQPTPPSAKSKKTAESA